ncbi:hypothetical protein N8J89_37960 [Crossiella sp. CA-258035]|uniref:hypothetical protein n=1 Tax=Crossiella sp. CA-258035 TaxID=2981138 RepID=UPI0024BC7C1D|nr:hypothetical protein [Crossiella sp. CA-258035]WHT18829.1 hypothetical protein N8J89_37960 [Crossiella sp. CA-258035]
MTAPATHKAVWTALPNGFHPDGRARLSVLVSPRIEAVTLGSGPFLDWPLTLTGLISQLGLVFSWAGQTHRVAVEVENRYAGPDSTLWQALFPPGSPCQSTVDRAANGAITELRSFPGTKVREQVTGFYRRMAGLVAEGRLNAEDTREVIRGCGDPPPESQLGFAFPSKGNLRTDRTFAGASAFAEDPAAAFRSLNRLLEPQGGIGIAAQDRPRHIHRDDRYGAKLTFAESFQYYQRNSFRTDDEPAPPAAPEKPKLTVAGVCGLLGDYPALQRRFGLVVDLLLTLPAGLPETGATVSVDPGPGAPASLKQADLLPLTRLRHLPGQRFEAATEDQSRYRDRYLDLSQEQSWAVTDLDLDSAAIRIADFSAAVERIRAQAGNRMGTGLPALRNAGITLLAADRDAWFADQLAGNTVRTNAAEAPTVTAEALVRGYRVDVGLAESPSAPVTAWYSLCRRRGSYALRPATGPVIPITGVAEDEGQVKTSATTKSAPADTRAFTHEALFGWDGWSLSAPRPGRTIAEDGTVVVPERTVDEKFPLDTSFTPVPGSLPKLRFGQTYRLRARLVDLAGNSPELTDPSTVDIESDPITYRRWEPVPHPVVVPRHAFNEGESTERLVIRSTVDEDGREVSATFWALDNRDVPDHDDDPLPADGLSRRYRDTDERHLAPPKAALQLAEQHGKYDDVLGGNPSAEQRRRFLLAASREAGSFTDVVVRRADNPEFTVDLRNRIKVATHNSKAPGPVTDLRTLRKGGELKEGEFVVHTDDDLLLPYLPDPLARGLSLRGLPTEDPEGTNEVHSFYGILHREWPDAGPIRLVLEEGDGEPRFSAASRTLTVQLLKGEVRTIRLSCALAEADLELLHGWRLLTESEEWQRFTPAERELLTRATVDGENWMLTPWVDLTLVHAVERPIARPVLHDLSFPRVAESTFTEVHGVLVADAPSTGRVDVDATWQEWLDDPAEDAPRRVSARTRVGGLELREVEDNLAFGVGKLKHEFGDTRHRNVGYVPVGTTRFREYFHPSITADLDRITSVGPVCAAPDGKPWPVPSSRRPLPPRPAYLVPTFRWETVADEENRRRTSLRRCAGVRIYLERPWFSSGDDELLAVVLDPQRQLPPELRSDWGVDPVWAESTQLPPLAADRITNPAATATGLAMAETLAGGPATVDVVAVQPEFDADKGLWFADVDLDPGVPTAYFPLLRLAVARYQPHSVTGLELSSIVLAEFTQLVPARTLLAEETADSIRLTLRGAATADALGAKAGAELAAAAASRRVRVSVQVKRSTEEEFDWRQVATGELTCVADGAGFAWTGGLPPVEVSITRDYRLVLEEHERHQADPGAAEETVPVGGTPTPVGYRLVHADRVPLEARIGRLVLDFPDFIVTGGNTL